MKKLGLFVFLLTIIAACGGISDDTVQDKKKEVMEVHDRTMAQMGTMSNLQKEINKRNEGDTIETLSSAKTDLQEAHNMMMEWMKDFSNTYDENWPNERKLEFLSEEKEKMEVVEKKSNEAINAAELLLQESKGDTL